MNENIGGYETYAVPIDGKTELNDNMMKAQGYSLAEFYMYLEQKTGKTVPAWKVVDAYKESGYSITGAIMKVYGIRSKQDLSQYWKGYLQSIAEKLGNRIRKIQDTNSDSSGAMPSYLRKITLGKSQQSQRVTVDSANFSAKSGQFSISIRAVAIFCQRRKFKILLKMTNIVYKIYLNL